MDSNKDALLKSFGITSAGVSGAQSGGAGSTHDDVTSVAITLDDMQSAITVLADTLLQIQNYTTIDAETYEEMRNRLVSRAEDFVNASLFKSLNDDEQAEFAELLESGTATEQELYLREHISDIHKVVHSGLKAFCDGYLSNQVASNVK